MKILIHDLGDQSVGISPTYITVDGLYLSSCDREYVREILTEAFSEIQGNRVRIDFEDEMLA